MSARSGFPWWLTILALAVPLVLAGCAGSLIIDPADDDDDASADDDDDASADDDDDTADDDDDTADDDDDDTADDDDDDTADDDDDTADDDVVDDDDDDIAVDDDGPLVSGGCDCGIAGSHPRRVPRTIASAVIPLAWLALRRRR